MKKCSGSYRSSSRDACSSDGVVSDFAEEFTEGLASLVGTGCGVASQVRPSFVLKHVSTGSSCAEFGNSLSGSKISQSVEEFGQLTVVKHGRLDSDGVGGSNLDVRPPIRQVEMGEGSEKGVEGN